MASVRSLQSGQVRTGRGWSGRTDDRAVRSRLEEQPLQDLEQDELGSLLSTAGSRRVHSQKEWRREDFRCADTPGIMHLMQFALGMMDEDGLNSRPIFEGADRDPRRW